MTLDLAVLDLVVGDAWSRDTGSRCVGFSGWGGGKGGVSSCSFAWSRNTGSRCVGFSGWGGGKRGVSSCRRSAKEVAVAIKDSIYRYATPQRNSGEVTE